MRLELTGGHVVLLLERDGEEPTSHELSGGDGDTTNNRMELTAVIKALEALPSGLSLSVHREGRPASPGDG